MADINLGRVRPTVSVGTTTTGAPGSNAQVTQAGTALDRTLNFTIPRGEMGVAGAPAGGVDYDKIYTVTNSGSHWNNTRMNLVTIPGFTYDNANRDKIIFLSKLEYQGYQWGYVRDPRLNINSLGDLPVYGYKEETTRIGYGSGSGGKAIWQFLDGGSSVSDPGYYWWQDEWTGWGGWRSKAGESRSPIMVRFNGTHFEVVRRDDVWNETKRHLWGNADPGTFYRNLAITPGPTCRIGFNNTNYVQPIGVPNAPGIALLELEQWGKTKGGYYSPFTETSANYPRRILLKSWNMNNTPAFTCRFQEASRTRSRWKDSWEINENVTTGYKIRVAKRLLDTATVSKGPNYVDIPYPGGVDTEVEILWKLNWPKDQWWGLRGGLYPSHCPTHIRQNPHESCIMIVDILEVNVMQNL